MRTDADHDCPYGNDACTYAVPCRRCNGLMTHYAARREAYAALTRDLLTGQNER